jgi:hypothetical protein
MLRDKRIVASDLPLSTKPDTKNKRYRIADSYLRFWLAFLQRGIPLIERGRGDLALTRIERSWTTWRGPAIEPSRPCRVLPEVIRRTLGSPRTDQSDYGIGLIGAQT